MEKIQNIGETNLRPFITISYSIIIHHFTKRQKVQRK